MSTLTKETKMYQRDSNQAFTNAKAKGLNNSQDYEYMYSKGTRDFFIRYYGILPCSNRAYISFNQ